MMSGGSYHYAYRHSIHEGVALRAEVLRDMAQSALCRDDPEHGIKHRKKIAKHLLRTAERLEAIAIALDAIHEANSDLMHAIEWVVSCDWRAARADEVWEEMTGQVVTSTCDPSPEM
jgi:hypothetical protein